MRRAREIVIALLGLGALALGALLVSPRPAAPGGAGGAAAPGARAFPGSTFDSGPRGARALYLLLAALGHQVERRTSPSAAVANERVRIVIGPVGAPDGPTLAWVQRGNTLVLAPPPPGTPPGERAHGSGRVVALPSAAALENGALRRDPAPAVAIAALCAGYGHGGRVVFDESPRGAGALLATLARFPVGVALIQALVAVLLLAWARGPRFGPVLAVAGTASWPAARAQVAATADLYEAAAAAPLAARVLRAHFRQRAVHALGVPPGIDDDSLATRFCQRYGGAAAELGGHLQAAADPRLRSGDLPRVARGLHDYEQRMEL